MTSRRPNSLIRFLRRITAAQGVDGELLERFVSQQDESAFAELVRRHGPMVFGVCRRLLGDTPDAEDAFQATFLVLARRAGSITRPALLANWLFGVARRASLKARVTSGRRRAREAPLADLPADERVPSFEWADIRPVLDDEISRLPKRYRTAFVLCHLEGRTNDDAARLLGCPKGTILSRLAWARQRLRIRLTRRGLAFPAGLFTTALGTDTLSAAVPRGLASATVRAALPFAAGHTTDVIPAAAAALAEQVLGAFAMTKFRIALVMLLGAGTLAFAAGVGKLAVGQDRPMTDAAAPPMVAANHEPTIPPPELQSVSVKSMPPVVVRTEPQAGDTQVDATKVTEIRATFSKEMADKSWSWAQIAVETFPKVMGDIRYEKDQRTCVLPVRLEPGKTYVLWVNSERFTNFKDASGQSAVPYLLVFETKK